MRLESEEQRREKNKKKLKGRKERIVEDLIWRKGR